MPITTKRIMNLENAASVANDDYIALDGATKGTRKYATNGKGLSKNDYTDADKAALAGAVSDLAQYQGIFTGNLDTSIQNWLNAHPEATTTVQDGAITFEKLSQGLADTINGKTNSNIPFSKEYYNQLYIDVCRIENGIFRNEVNNIEDIKKDILYAVNTGADHFCVMIEMCMYNGTYYRPLTNAILDEIMTYADSLGAAIDFIKIHENTPIETISDGYTSWLNAYTEEVGSLFTVCINHNVKHLTVMNEKADVYNSDNYYSDIVSLISEVKNHGFKSGVTANSMVRTEVLTVASYDYQNVYPRIAYNADLQNDDIYDVMLKNTKIILADRQNIAIEKPVFISEIGCKPYIEYLAFPAKYSPESYWTFSTHAFRQYFYNAFKAIQNIDAVVGFCDFYNHGYLESGYIGNVRNYWMKGDVNNVIV